jgi:hypothetical protein
MATQDSRIKLKRSTIAATVPTVPSSNDHTDGTWIATDIYKGELFYNQADGVLWTRGDSGIECIQGTAKITIASADVLTLNTTPITIVAAQGVGTAIEVLSASAKMVYNSSDYATNGNMIIRCVGANSAQVGFDDNGFLFGTVSRIVPSASVLSDGTTDTFLIENSNLEITVETGDPTAGDSDITVYVTYRIITL